MTRLRARWARLVCRVRGHDRVRVIDKIDWSGAVVVAGSPSSALSWPGRATAWHAYCRRCGDDL